MNSCNNCARLKFNYDGKVFRCGRNCEKTFDNPKINGIFCRHHTKQIVKNNTSDKN